MNNLYLIISLVALGYILSRRLIFSKNVKNVTAEEAYELMKSNKELVIIDVRTKQEYKGGHIPGAKSIPLNEISSRISEIEKFKDKPILVHCASGGRSPAAVKTLLKHGINNVYHMKHGLMTWSYGLKK